MRRSLSLLPLLLAACVPASRPPEAPPAPPPTRVATPPPALPVPEPGSDWRDWPLTPGSWSYGSSDTGTLAMFGDRQGRVLMINCFRMRPGVAITGAFGSEALTIRTTSVARAVPTVPVEDGTGYRRAALAPTDPLLDALAFSRGRFVVEQAGRPPLVIPAHAEIGRVIEDCRG